MKKSKVIISIVLSLCLLATFTACNGFANPGDTLGGGQAQTGETPTETTVQAVEDITAVTEDITQGDTVQSGVPTSATQITSATEITENGDYVLSGTIDIGDGQIKIAKNLSNVTLYFNGVTIAKTTDKKIINAKSSITIVLVEGTTNTLSSSFDDCDCIGSDFNLTITGEGTLNATATDDAISADGTLQILGGTYNLTSTGGHGLAAENVVVKNCTITTTTADKDGIHAESPYDELTTAPTFSYEKGYVYIDGATFTATTSGGDGIQADSFVQIINSNINITTGGGAPTTITEYSSDNGNGKGIKAGVIDYGVDGTELESDGYSIYIVSGNFTLNTNDDAIHSNGTIVIDGGSFSISSGDDGIHADNLLQIKGGNITVNKCYEGIESAKIEISGGEISVTSADDAINAADGTQTVMGRSNNNCHIIISGGTIYVNASGDGIDSNGTILMSGGFLYVGGPVSGANSSLDSDGGFIVTGGTLFAVGSLGMVETPSTSSAQYCVSFATNTNITAGTILYLTDNSGNVLCQYTTSKVCRSVIISCSALTKGETYCIYAGNTKMSTFTVSSIITQVGTRTTSNNPGGMPGRR